MTTAVVNDAEISDGVSLDASIFDDRNYVEVDAVWLANAEGRVSKRRELEAETLNMAVARN